MARTYTPALVRIVDPGTRGIWHVSLYIMNGVVTEEFWGEGRTVREAATAARLAAQDAADADDVAAAGSAAFSSRSSTPEGGRVPAWPPSSRFRGLTPG